MKRTVTAYKSYSGKLCDTELEMMQEDLRFQQENSRKIKNDKFTELFSKSPVEEDHTEYLTGIELSVDEIRMSFMTMQGSHRSFVVPMSTIIRVAEILKGK